jgi:DNA repair exonuclease SbcCD nuclease subunit
MRFVHFADLHLDAPFRRLPPEVGRARRQALRRALDATIQLAERERADAILCAGDLFEHDRITPDTINYLRERFGSAGRPVFISPGNHDWLAGSSPYTALSWPDNVHIFRSRTLTSCELAPGLLLWGAAHQTPRGTPNFFQLARATPGAKNLVLVHASDRATLSFQGPDKEAHAPFDAADIAVAGFAHAFLGHFHTPTAAPLFTYPGNPDPLSFGESGQRGAVVADLTSPEIQRRWVVVGSSLVFDATVDLTGTTHRDDALQRIRQAVSGLSGAIRLRLIGEVDPALDFDPLVDCDPDQLGLHRGPDRALVVEASALRWAYDLAAIRDEVSVRGELLRRVTALPEVTPGDRDLVLRMGLRALAGRTDLEVI